MKKHLLKIFLIVIIFFLVIFFFTKSVKSFLNTHPAFKIKKIATSHKPYPNGHRQATGYRLKEEEIKKILNISEQTSIFSLNLKKASKRLEEKPEIKKAVIIRRFPDTLIIQLKERKPVAQIGVRRYFLIDEEGVILPGPKNFPFANFPLIEGIDFPLSEPKIGRRYISQNLYSGLSIIKFLSSFGEFTPLEVPATGGAVASGDLLLTGFKLKKINVKDVKNILLYLQIDSPDLSAWSGKTVLIKINIPEDNEAKNALKKKIRLLKEILPLHRPQDVKYIDLRFKDIMVGRK
ncbi:MAG: FtsQ-type POTRA domain-containing protein [Candidatus Omnitrophica bacterium]|nr:FtsQ-type POTRA domain-containing protein [Candidatus Omnitrophota bacterium]